MIHDYNRTTGMVRGAARAAGWRPKLTTCIQTRPGRPKSLTGHRDMCYLDALVDSCRWGAEYIHPYKECQVVSYQDRMLRCRDCGIEFLFSAGEQEFFAAKGYVNDPSRCPTCRTAFRARHPAGGPRQREMHPAVCAKCGTPTQVPFLPRQEKPVYCSTCFDQVRAVR